MRWRSDSPATYVIVNQGSDSPPGPGQTPESSHGNDVRVLDSRRDANLAQEPLDADRAGELGVEHLEGDHPIVP
jgi:hypothetical protein